MRQRYCDYFLLYFLIVVSAVSTYFFARNLLTALILFYALPALWLSVKEPRYVKRAAIFALFGAIVFFAIDYVATLDKAWWISTIFPRLLGILAVENSIWAFIGLYTIILFYEHFDDGAKFHKSGNKHTALARKLVLLLIVLFGVVYILRPEILRLSYAYLWLGLLFVFIPSILVLTFYPHLRRKVLDVSLYVFCLHLTLELMFLHRGFASYPGTHFIGWVELTGVRYPIEELIFWIGMCAVVSVSYYEVCLDDGR